MAQRQDNQNLPCLSQKSTVTCGEDIYGQLLAVSEFGKSSFQMCRGAWAFSSALTSLLNCFLLLGLHLSYTVVQEKDEAVCVRVCLNRYNRVFLGKCLCPPMWIMRKFHSSSEEMKKSEIHVFVQLMTRNNCVLRWTETIQLSVLHSWKTLWFKAGKIKTLFPHLSVRNIFWILFFCLAFDINLLFFKNCFI